MIGGFNMQSRRDFLRALGLSAAYLALNGSLKGADRPAGRPNIILCMADDQGWGEMGYYGHPGIENSRLRRNGCRWSALRPVLFRRPGLLADTGQRNDGPAPESLRRVSLELRHPPGGSHNRPTSKEGRLPSKEASPDRIISEQKICPQVRARRAKF